MKIEFIHEAAIEYKSLDGSLKVLADKILEKLEKNPFLGEELGNKNNMDLSGYYKLYFNKKKHRIVYRIVKNDIEIWRIGKMDKMEIYKAVNERITN